MEKRLPAGQFELKDFPRFGLSRFAPKFPANPDQIRFEIAGDVEQTLILEGPFAGLSRQERTEDFHCVTTWSARGQKWGGVAFSEFFDQVVLQQARPEPGAELVVFRGEDGYCSSLPLQDLMADGVLLADQLNGERLGIEHGAPLRLVAPAHYGYKNVKHIVRIEFWRDGRNYRFPFPYPSFMDHPRGRVAYEERGRWFPGWLLRCLYRMIIPLSIANFKSKTRKYRQQQSKLK